ncbi:MAG TPA: Stk1 family PASTA domain-containing Ser/Thr kinase [Limnochordales bacterium]|nr:Stk1 family PASTA domain-containing Ser/Thr kinase [Limnochordales bacterium]
MIDTLLANRYRIQAKIGDGGMAVVYRALDIVLHRPVAIKCLRPQFASDPEFRQRFIQEAQAAASLSHPNVVNIFDVGRAGDVHYIVLEYVQGRNLKEILREEGRLSPRRAAHIARAVARALEAAHRRQLIHRDIKPHNILITPEGRVKVTDFGIARAASTATLTQTGTVIGSVHYFSPEQARGEAVGPASDLYSLGVVLYEMLTGTVPFVGESPIAVAIKHVQEEPVPPRRHVPTIPVWLERVVLKALAKDPAQRYASAEEMAQDLAWRTDQVAARPLAPADEEDWSAGDGAEPRGLEDRVEQRTRRVAAVDLRQLEAAGVGSEAAAEDDGARPRRRSVRRGVLAALVLLVALGAAAYASAPFLLRLIFPPEVTVPDVVGLTYAEARQLMAARGLLLVIEAERHDRLVPAGHILRQNPEGGRIVREGRTIYVTLSQGPELGVVPDVTDRPLREARLMLTQEGYVLGEEIPVFRPGVPVNVVVDQDPAPGTAVEKGTPVKLWVVRPEEAVPTAVVPDVRGRTLAEAQRELEDLGLALGNAWPEVNPLIPAGRVIDQNPAPGTAVEQGSAVDVVFSSASAPETAHGDGQAGAADPAPSAPVEAGTPAPPAGPMSAVDDAPHAAQSAADGWEDALLALDQKRRTARVDIYVPPGPPQEVVILVIDDFGAREVHRETLAGGTHVRHFVEGRGDNARLQVYIGGMMEVDEPFPR